MNFLILATILALSLSADGFFSSAKKGVAPVKNKFYKSECASCHFAYQAGLLPERSWKKLMGDLENHFGTDASLDKKDTQTLLSYLSKNSADKFINYKRSRKIKNSISKTQIPIAVSDTPYFIKKHKGIAQKYISQKEVKSISNCIACHTTAQKGIYGERYINIPNYGRWDDD